MRRRPVHIVDIYLYKTMSPKGVAICDPRDVSWTVAMQC